MTTPRCIIFASFCLLTFSAAHAQGPENTPHIDDIFSWTSASTPGCAVTVARDGDIVINRAYGMADLEREVPLTPDTVFDAGSLQKQFVAAAVLLLVDDGVVALSDDVRAYLPEMADTGHRVTIDHLLTHTSGIRDWTGMLPLAAGDPDALTLILRQRGLNFAPGDEWSYSNSGYVLAKEIVARASGMPFDRFTHTRMFEPLGMTATRFTLEVTPGVGNLALAYEKRGSAWQPDMLNGQARGGWALLSTAPDLARWNEALTRERLGPLVSARLREPATLNSGRRLPYARGLSLDRNRGGQVIWHSGSAAGYKSVLSRFPEQRLSVAIICNAGDSSDRVRFAAEIFDRFVEGTRAPQAAPDPVGIPADAAYAGLFFDERTGAPLRLGVQGERLRIAGGPALVPVTADRFRRVGDSLDFLSGAAFEMRFESPDQFALVPDDGAPARFRRARPYTPDATALDAFAGLYESAEIGGAFRVSVRDSALALSLAHAPGQTLTLSPADADTFQRGMIFVRFRRDADGKVVALEYRNPVIRGVTFTRRGV